MRSWAVIVALAAVAGLAVFLVPTAGVGDTLEALRVEAQQPEPTEQERVDYFLDLVRTAQVTNLGRLRPPTGRIVGEAGLIALGPVAADSLMDAGRQPQWVRDPALADSVLKLVPKIPGAAGRPGFYPFLLRLLDPEQIRPKLPRADWGALYRSHIFSLFTHYRDPRAVPYCIEELELGKHAPDMRQEAITVLLSLGHVDEYAAAYGGLPPNEEEPENVVRPLSLERVRELADPANPQQMRASARRLEPLLRRALGSEISGERIRAAACLLRLGDESMVERLIHEYETEKQQNLALAWLALEHLGRDRRDPYCRDVFLKTVRTPKEVELGTRIFQASVTLLAARWSDDKEVMDELWRVFRTRETPDPHLGRVLAAIDRERVTAHVIRSIRHRPLDQRWMWLALAVRLKMREINPVLLELAQEEHRYDVRARYFSTLAALRAYDAVPFVTALFRNKHENVELRRVAANCLLDIGAPEGVEAVGAALRELDEVALDATVARAAAVGAAGVPPALIPQLGAVLRRAPGMQSRRKALFVIRVLGDRELGEPELRRAYRAEPSDRLADEIGEVLRELAYR